MHTSESQYGRVALDALRDESLQDSIRKGIQPSDQFFSDLELDLADWSLTYGVAWATARERQPQLSGSDLAAEAHAAAAWAFEVYCGGKPWSERWKEDREERGPVRGDPGTPAAAWVEGVTYGFTLTATGEDR